MRPQSKNYMIGESDYLISIGGCAGIVKIIILRRGNAYNITHTVH